MPSAKRKRGEDNPAPLDRLIVLLAQIEVARYVGTVRGKKDEIDHAGEDGSDLRPLQR